MAIIKATPKNRKQNRIIIVATAFAVSYVYGPVWGIVIVFRHAFASIRRNGTKAVKYTA